MSTVNKQLQEKLERAEADNEGLRSERLKANEKLRELEWSKDQDTKQLTSMVKKLRDEHERLKMEHL